MKLLTSLLLSAVIGIPALAQPQRPPGPPGPPRTTGTYATVSGTISQFNYDRDGDIEGFLLNNNTVVHLPPRAAVRAGSVFTPGDAMQIKGYANTNFSGMQSIEAESIQDKTNGRSLTALMLSQPAPYSGSGTIRQLNYDAVGSINGFLLENGTFVLTRPFGASSPSSIQRGAKISFAGYAKKI